MSSSKNINSSKFIERIESELLSALFNYAVPFIDKKIDIKKTKKEENKKTSSLENIVNQKPKVGLNDLKEIESLLLKNLDKNVKSNKKIGIDSNEIFYSLNLIKNKNNLRLNKKQENYSISIKYEENQSEEKLSVSIKKDSKEVYSAEVLNKKDAKDKVLPYSISIFYENKYNHERLSIDYNQQIKNYLKQHIESKEDMANRVPLKWLNILPESQMGGILGFTYLGENFMGRRADLVGKTARMVDIHESIHTPDEYETRILTSWIMGRTKPKYIK